MNMFSTSHNRFMNRFYLLVFRIDFSSDIYWYYVNIYQLILGEILREKVVALCVVIGRIWVAKITWNNPN